MIIKKFIIGIFLFFLGSTMILAQESYNRLLFEGNKNFSKKEFENSSTKFKEAAKLKKDDFAAHYNLANSYYKRNMFEEAKSEYELAQKFAKNKSDKMAALYNLGNSYMKINKPEKAAEFYKQSLKQDPYNEKIRKNYEIAKLKDKEKQNQQNKKNDSGKGGGDGKNKDESKDNKDGKNPQNGNNGQNTPSPQNGDGNENQKPKENNQMPKDLEDAILNRVSNKEKETARRILNKNSYSTPESKEKDW
mgnify:CR=1 FL=1